MKLPTATRPIIHDAEMAAAIERLLAPLDGKKLEKAQAAVRKVAMSAVIGSFGAVLDAYKAAIAAAIGDKET